MTMAFGRIAALPILTLVAVLPMSGCMRINNSFSVSDPHHSASSAELRLCGWTAQLSRTARGFYVSVPITCEGDGKVVVQLADGREASCLVGYVTGGAMQNFDYVLEGTECRTISIHSETN